MPDKFFFFLKKNRTLNKQVISFPLEFNFPPENNNNKKKTLKKEERKAFFFFLKKQNLSPRTRRVWYYYINGFQQLSVFGLV
jgi:hypothetical protein